MIILQNIISILNFLKYSIDVSIIGLGHGGADYQLCAKLLESLEKYNSCSIFNNKVNNYIVNKTNDINSIEIFNKWCSNGGTMTMYIISCTFRINRNNAYEIFK